MAGNKASTKPLTNTDTGRGRVGRWPGALAPGWPGHGAALWQRRWPLPWQRGQAECGNTFWPIHGRDQETRPAFPPPLRNGPL